MPRDISGNYTLPAGNPVVNGTVIDVTWGNGTLNDIATQLNNVITRDGILNPTAPIRFASGTAAAPGISFSADPAVGLFRAASNTLGFAAAGTSWATLTGTGNWLLSPAGVGITLSTPDITVTGTSNLNGLITNIGDSAVDVLNVAGAAINWTGSPVHSGTHTFAGTASGVLPTLPGQFATKDYVDNVVVPEFSAIVSAMSVCQYLGL